MNSESVQVEFQKGNCESIQVEELNVRGVSQVPFR